MPIPEHEMEAEAGRTFLRLQADSRAQERKDIRDSSPLSSLLDLMSSSLFPLMVWPVWKLDTKAIFGPLLSIVYL